MDAPPSERTVSSVLRPLLAIWLCTLCAALLVYGATMAPGIVWQDSAEAQVRVALDDWRGQYGLARSHILYFMLASVGRHGLDADPAWAANLISVITGALAVANVAALLCLLLKHRVAALAATALLALSHTFWQFSTMAETYALVGALLSAQLLVLAVFDRTRRGWLICLVGLLNGLAASNHNLALLTLGCYALVGLGTFPTWWRLYRRYVIGAAILWVIGYAPMLVLILGELRAGTGVVATIASLLVGDYADHVFNMSIGFRDAVRLLAMFGLNFPTPLLIAAFVGWPGLTERCSRGLRFTFAMLLIAHFLFAVRYDIVDQYSFLVPTYVILSVFLGGGIDWFLRRCRSDRRRTMSAVILAAVCLPPIVYGVLPALARRLPPAVVPVPKRPVPHRDPYTWFLQPWHHGYDGAERFARETLEMLPPNAFVLNDTTMRGPVVLLQVDEGLRHDVHIADGLIQPFRDRWKPTPDEFRQLVKEGRLFAFFGDRKLLSANRWIGGEFCFQPTGPVYQLVPCEDVSD